MSVSTLFLRPLFLRCALPCTLMLSALCLAPAAQALQAETTTAATAATTTAAKKTVKAKAEPKGEPKAKTKAKSKNKKAEATAVVEAEPQEDEPDISGSTTTDFDCELGNKVTIFTNTDDADHIALRWKKRLHRLTRVGTTTGAQRFENPLFGLIWIGIPTKGMLLDSKQNRQLANECKDAEQMKPVAAVAMPAPATDKI